MEIHDEGEEELRVLGHGLVARTEQLEESLPLLEGVVVLAHEEAHEGELQLGQDLVIPATMIK